MLFNSLAYLVFFPTFLVGYALTRGRGRLWLLVGASYFFYGWWDWRFTALLWLSTTVDFYLAAAIAESKDPVRRKRLLVFSLVINLGVLAFFKYFGFFVDSAATALSALGLAVHPATLSIALPVGISFYTFHSLSYTIDVFRDGMKPEKSLLRYSAFVAMFPHLVAGPIVRAHDILPQLRVDQPITAARWHSGMSLVVWGFFKKIVVADNLAAIVDPRFASPAAHGGLSLAVGIVAYAFQIYADFSGYSDIAIGTARILGYDFPVNFVRPYFASSFSEFWQRWHVSLSSWLRDYLYIPLGGNRGGAAATHRNLMLTMLLGGLWHGANWTFVVWGVLHGLYLVGQRVLAPCAARLTARLRLPGIVTRGVATATVFFLTCLAWVFFRSPTFTTAFTILRRVSSTEGWNPAGLDQKFLVVKAAAVIVILLLGDALAEGASSRGRSVLGGRPVLRGLGLAAACWAIALFGAFRGSQFIYFQF